MSKKLYYKIGEACKSLDIQPYVLRYWETEFSMLSPEKSKSGQRVYNEQDLAIISRIKELLYDEGFTIAGAKKRLEVELAAADGGSESIDKTASEPKVAANAESKLDSGAEKRIETLLSGVRDLREEAREILALLDKPPAKG